MMLLHIHPSVHCNELFSEVFSAGLLVSLLCLGCTNTREYSSWMQNFVLLFGELHQVSVCTVLKFPKVSLD